MNQNNFELNNYPIYLKLKNFEKFVDRQALTRFLARYELFKKIIDVKGSIIECGVHHGGGLFAWAKLSAGLEPMAINRKIIGFDTFEGFPSVKTEDKGLENIELKEGGLKVDYDIFEELVKCKEEYDSNRFLNQFEKMQLIKGDAIKTIPEYVENNQHLVVSLLFLDFDLYEPTKVALESFVPRMPKGSILAFDEINNPWWPGETKAMVEYFKSLNNYRIQKFPFDPNIAFIEL